MSGSMYGPSRVYPSFGAGKKLQLPVWLPRADGSHCVRHSNTATPPADCELLGTKK